MVIKNIKYVKTNDGHIYKLTSNPNVFIKVSPYEPSEDRRIYSTELFNMINGNNATRLTKRQALEEINTLWRNHTSKWVYCGRQYKNKNEHFSFSEAKKYKFTFKFINYKGEECTSTRVWFICVHNGRLYWVQNSQYYPQLCLYEFKDVNTEPSYNDFVKWTNIKNIKNLYEKDYNGKWICI